METLTTTRDVIDALGGISKVAELTERKYGTAAQWPHFSTFPSNTYVALTEALARIDKAAPPSLWGMAAVQERAAS